MKFKNIFSICLLSTSFLSSAKIYDYKTTLLKSTAGTGVASPLIEEATILNPSTLAFYNISTLYIEKISGDVTPESDTVNKSESDNYGVVLSDTKGRLKGSLSYFSQTRDDDERKTYASSLASNLGKKSAMGFTVKKVDDKVDGVKTSTVESTIGVSHFINSDFSIGLVADNIFKQSDNPSLAVVGFRYSIADYVSIMADAGANVYDEMSETSLVRGAIQFKIYNNFFFRFGASEDKGKKERTTGTGISWVQPKLAFNLALTNSKYGEIPSENQQAEKIKETSFSMSYRF